MDIDSATKLHRTIWHIANELRGSVDSWDFKQYVLGLFYRFIWNSWQFVTLWRMTIWFLGRPAR